jgi:hypothetical protein
MHFDAVNETFYSFHVESKDRVLKQRARTKDSVSETSPLGSCGVSSNSDGWVLFT